MIGYRIFTDVRLNQFPPPNPQPIYSEIIEIENCWTKATRHDGRVYKVAYSIA